MPLVAALIVLFALAISSDNPVNEVARLLRLCDRKNAPGLSSGELTRLPVASRNCSLPMSLWIAVKANSAVRDAEGSIVFDICQPHAARLVLAAVHAQISNHR